MVHIPILVLVAPHWTATAEEQPIGLRYLGHGGAVALAVLLCNNAATTTASATCASGTRESLPHGILCLDANEVTHLLTVTGHGLLGGCGGNWWNHILVLPQRLHLEGLKVRTEI